MIHRKILLTEKEIPTKWYNIVADMPNKPLPPLHPGTKQPIGPEALAPLFPMELIKQEVSAEKWIEIPDEVRDLYTLWRPTVGLYDRHLRIMEQVDIHVHPDREISSIKTKRLLLVL